MGRKCTCESGSEKFSSIHEAHHHFSQCTIADFSAWGRELFLGGVGSCQVRHEG